VTVYAYFFLDVFRGVAARRLYLVVTHFAQFRRAQFGRIATVFVAVVAVAVFEGRVEEWPHQYFRGASVGVMATGAIDGCLTEVFAEEIIVLQVVAVSA